MTSPMMRLPLVLLLALVVGVGVAACENRGDGGLYVEGGGGVSVGN